MAKAKKISQSRTARWERAVAKCMEARDTVNESIAEVNAAVAEFNSAREELIEVQQEYQDWLDNLPENLANSPVAEKLNDVTNLSIDEFEELSDVEADWLDEAEAVDLPRGFGRD